MDTVNVLGTEFITGSMDALVAEMDERLSQKQQTFVVTANPEIMMYAEKDKAYAEILNKADYITPDGIGIVIGSKILKRPIQERLAGYDLVHQLFTLAVDKGYSVYFLGAKPDVIERASAYAQQLYPRLNIVGYHHGFFDLNDPSIMADIKSKSPDIILVGLGFPRQEQWIDKYRRQMTKGLFIGVGGSFDVLAGEVKRAPLVWRKANLEWLYRLINQPSRWRRMLVLPVYLIKAYKAR
ncbi:acetylglucosaminyldiphosphoundecaprenol acetyl-beta-D-mannosaminyltransferase [Pullulanibacillus camelliae]|uniref:N-acetylglucosaminyldiphosphoundecaprenol N-acetyl-beta-D-mannosaminyltransferase n=1 Tax=Pullulanibacillus camelliae TaxID=1707096 RepID=A0A8J2YN02_9BACL|nr:acetylglucosaminyldiphosphoundecaprenol acetyl-beta-D-mannosaminyltransferase [Pullulanibacillus camelliae]